MNEGLHLCREASFCEAYHPPLLAYLEALPPSYGHIGREIILLNQNKDGSLFQSPSATAHAFMVTGNEGFKLYLESMVQRCGHGGGENMNHPWQLAWLPCSSVSFFLLHVDLWRCFDDDGTIKWWFLCLASKQTVFAFLFTCMNVCDHHEMVFLISGATYYGTVKQFHPFIPSMKNL